MAMAGEANEFMVLRWLNSILRTRKMPDRVTSISMEFASTYTAIYFHGGGVAMPWCLVKNGSKVQKVAVDFCFQFRRDFRFIPFPVIGRDGTTSMKLSVERI